MPLFPFMMSMAVVELNLTFRFLRTGSSFSKLERLAVTPSLSGLKRPNLLLFEISDVGQLLELVQQVRNQVAVSEVSFDVLNLLKRVSNQVTFWSSTSLLSHFIITSDILLFKYIYLWGFGVLGSLEQLTVFKVFAREKLIVIPWAVNDLFQ